MNAKAGDRIVVESERAGQPARSCVIEEVVSADPPRYRVRVGKFKTKREAEQVAARLQKEEQFKPWITR